MKIAAWLSSLAGTATPDIEECIAVLGDQIGWLHRLKDTEQDAQWHAEGNVHIHTNMVLTELYKLLASGASHIVGEQRQALVLSALFHDIAKPERTRSYEIDGQIRVGAPKHAYYGASYLAFKLTELDLEFSTVWTILGLVAEHHTPKLLVVKNMSKSNYLKHARQANTELVYWLEVADIRGRLCPDPEHQLQCLEEYRMFAEEYRIWGNENDVRSDLKPALCNQKAHVQDYVYAHAIQQLESGKITMAEEAIGTTYEHRENHPHVIVLCGPSGSGKSTWIQKNHPDYTVVSLDDLRDKFNGDRSSQKNKGQIIQHAKEQLRVVLRSKGKVIWDATNLRQDFRSIIYTLSADYYALVTMAVFLMPESQIINKNRDRNHSVPDDVLKNQIDRYQFPLLDEAHQYMVLDGDGEVVYQSGYFRV